VGAVRQLWYNARVPSPLLAIKIGNSNVTVGVFVNAALIARWRIHTETNKTADEYAILFDDLFAQAAFRANGWRGAAIVSVVPPLTVTFQELCRRYFEIEPLVVTAHIETGMPIRYDDPFALGTDRWVAALAAKEKYGAPVIVIDFGTATTFNAVNRIATNTIHGIQAGIVFGYIGMIEGMVARMRAEMNEPQARVIATGGLASMLAPQTQAIDAVERDLVLEGLRIIFDMNRSSQSSVVSSQ